MNRIADPCAIDASNVHASRAATHVTVQPVILAGGSGTRLWPLSREQCPKQLIGLIDDESLLEATLRRLDAAFVPHGDVSGAPDAAEAPDAPLVTKAAPLVVCGEDLRLLTVDRLERCGRAARIVLEPLPRNTAPALTIAALAAQADAAAGNDPVLVVMPADHLIPDRAAFAVALEDAVTHAAGGAIVALGVPPQRAETGYGYIRTGLALGQTGAHAIDRFVEKPDAELAAHYVASGEYWWNSGIFVVRASVWLAAIALCRPAIASACADSFARGSIESNGAMRLDRAAFAACPSDSIDYAVMERIASDARLFGVAVPLVAGWSDIGAWDAVWQVSPKDADGNVGRGRVLFEGSSDTFAHSDGRLVACVGVAGVVVVETADAVLVVAKDRVQDVKAVVERLKAERGTEAKEHRKVSASS